MRRWVGIGEIQAGQRGDVLAAVLGSCVSTILWHAPSGKALMNHVLLPQRLVKRNDDEPGRYADESWQMMQRLLAREGMPLQECTCYVVGGGYGFEQGPQDVGGRNVAQVMALLQQARVQVDSCDVGGNWYRTVQFNLADGTLRIRRHKTARPRKPELARRQQGA
ncbi:chemotaxis protein CheD [Vogesella sp. LIG4]|uniref:chemotaxis protein CheD n=1 Tax=Vogesella sp. LIG4 TaxID=1192162 RepID=UPI00081FBD47|nr:chemotaxis protein CheD [Vogesella sp. LIG4]SCK29353.1 chemotaxis protein CheD [Vogesella sp. LIG4]